MSEKKMQGTYWDNTVIPDDIPASELTGEYRIICNYPGAGETEALYWAGELRYRQAIYDRDKMEADIWLTNSGRCTITVTPFKEHCLMKLKH